MTQPVPLQPGARYVLSIASDVAMRRVVAWAYLPGRDPPQLRQTEVLDAASPGTLVAQLQFQVGVVREAFFVVDFVAPGGTGEIGLFRVEG